MTSELQENIPMDVRFSNFEYDPSMYYALFISELKAYGIGHFFKEAIAKAKGIDINKIEFISIAPDIFEQYKYDNLIIINQLKTNESRRKNHDEFIQEISNSQYIDGVVETLLANQCEVYVYMFETSPFMTLNAKERVTLVGPDKEIVTILSNKIALYEIFSSLVPMANYQVCHSFDTLIEASQKLMKSSKDGLFVSLEKSAAGANSIIANSVEEIQKKFHSNSNDLFLVTEFIPHISDPTSLGVVIDEQTIYVAGVADQRICGTKFKGSTFPSKLSKELQEKIIDMTRTVGMKMASMGYRGIFGCDFIVTEDDKIFFIETNPRKQGTTMEFCCTLQNCLPSDAPNLPELEFYAVLHNKAAPNMIEPDFFDAPLHWGTYNYKIEGRLTTHSYLPHSTDEMAMFKQVSRKKITKEFMILEHVGQDYFVNEGSFLGRVIATGQSHKDVEDGINMGRQMISYTIKDYENDDFVPDEKCFQCKYYLNK